ncbi:hypothetical protein B0A56_08655 [Flavobacterium columnare NBRC 100251 = ATCC 23463]|nr:hypothetical protein B0A56_08655 [Flavobacterium columnare NBRC 100251 = ATCC 23463]
MTIYFNTVIDNRNYLQMKMTLNLKRVLFRKFKSMRFFCVFCLSSLIFITNFNAQCEVKKLSF